MINPGVLRMAKSIKKSLSEEQMSFRTEPIKRAADLTSTSIYTVVKAKENSGDNFWKEVADIVSVSASGAGFYLQRECRIGTLVSMMVPLPPHLRCYDHDKDLYRVWGLVQHCHQLAGEDVTGYHVGVAFIGKNPPRSYNDDPSQSYRICGMNDDGLWKIGEAKTAFKARRHVRFWKSIELYLALINNKKDAVGGERTVTENISKSGAAVYSKLDVSVGDRVKFISKEYDFSGLAVVCNRQVGEDDRVRLHLQFVENMFPIERIELPEAIIEEVED